MRAFVNNPREYTRFLRFIGVGLIGAVVDFGVMNLLTRAFNFPIVFAGSLSFSAAVLSNFLWNRYWTYPDSRSKPISWQMAQFGLVSLFGLAIRIPLLAVLEPLFETFFRQLPLNLPSAWVVPFANNSDLAVAVVVVMFWNFFINRFWTYNDIEK